MNVLNQLTVKSLTGNRKRTLVTIFGIILSTALICASAGLITSVQKTLVEEAKEGYGNYHAAFPGVSLDNLNYVEENRHVEDFYCIEGLGYATLSESINPDKPYLYLMAFDENAFGQAGIKLLKGRLPETDTELLLTQTVETNGGVEYQIGDVLKLSVGKRMSDGYELTQETPYLGGEEIEHKKAADPEQGNASKDDLEKTEEKESLTGQFEKSYTVVGMIERPNYTLEPYSAPGYSAVTKMEQVKTQADVYVLFEKAPKAASYALGIQKVLEKQQGWEREPVYNRQLLRYSGGMLSDDTLLLLFTSGSVVILIIIISSILVIRNSFAISITERMRQYGMLASVGATSGQIRKNVLFEGILLAAVGIPLGILSGVSAVFVLLSLMNYLLRDVLDIRLLYCLPVSVVFFAILLSLVTIYLSALSSARKAANISPMEAIRSSQDVKITAGNVRSPKMIRKLFGVGGEIAYKNLKRSRKKYRTTVVSMVVSIVLFLSMYAFVEYGFRYSGAYYSKMDYNLGIRLFISGDVKETYKVYKKISGLEGIDRESIVRRNIEYKVPEDKYLSELGKKMLQKEVEQGYDYMGAGIIIVSLGEEEYQRYLKKLGATSSQEMDAVLVEKGYQFIDDKKFMGNYYNVKEGELITAADGNGKEISMKLLKITQEKPMGLQSDSRPEGFFVVSEETIEALGYQDVDMRIFSGEPDGLEKKIDELLLTENKQMARLEGKQETFQYNIINVEQMARNENSMRLVIEILLYGFITVITLIGTTNIFNTITTNMNLRAREFAMLRSMGMTQREFSGMIRLESIFYGGKAMAFGLPVGTACAYLFFWIFDDHMDMVFSVPWKAYGLVVVFVMLIVGVTMKYSFGKIKNKNMIETIRKDTM